MSATPPSSAIKLPSGACGLAQTTVRRVAQAAPAAAGWERSVYLATRRLAGRYTYMVNVVEMPFEVAEVALGEQTRSGAWSQRAGNTLPATKNSPAPPLEGSHRRYDAGTDGASRSASRPSVAAATGVSN
jgi:hypothetical protein